MQLGEVDRWHSSVVLVACIVTAVPVRATAVISAYRARRPSGAGASPSGIDAVETDSDAESPVLASASKRTRIATCVAPIEHDFLAASLDIRDLLDSLPSLPLTDSKRRRLILFAVVVTGILRASGRSIAAVHGVAIRDVLQCVVWLSKFFGSSLGTFSVDADSSALLLAVFSMIAAASERDGAVCARELASVVNVLFKPLDIRHAVHDVPHDCWGESASTARCEWLREGTQPVLAIAISCVCRLMRFSLPGTSADTLSSQIMSAASVYGSPEPSFLSAAWRVLHMCAASASDADRTFAFHVVGDIVESSIACLRNATEIAQLDGLRVPLSRLVK